MSFLCYRGNAYYEEYSGEALYYLDYREDESSCDLCCVGPGGAKEILVEDFAAQPAVRKTTVPFTSGNVFIYGFLNEYVLVNHLYPSSMMMPEIWSFCIHSTL